MEGQSKAEESSGKRTQTLNNLCPHDVPNSQVKPTTERCISVDFSWGLAEKFQRWLVGVPLKNYLPILTSIHIFLQTLFLTGATFRIRIPA